MRVECGVCGHWNERGGESEKELESERELVGGES